MILNNPSSTLYYGGSNGFNTSTQNLSMVIGVNANYSQSLLFSDNYKNTGLNIQSIGSSGYASYSTVTHHGPIIFNHINNLYGSTNSITNSGAVVIYAATSSDSSYNHLVLTDYQSGTNSNASFAWGNIKYRYAGSTDYPEFKFEFTPEGNNGSPDWYFKLISGQTGIYTSSDERLKENIKELDDSLDKIL